MQKYYKNLLFTFNSEKNFNSNLHNQFILYKILFWFFGNLKKKTFTFFTAYIVFKNIS